MEWGKPLVDFASTSTPAALRCRSLLEGGSSFQICPHLPLPAPGESLGLLAGRRRRSGILILLGGAVQGEVGGWACCLVVGGGSCAPIPWLPALVVACWFFRIFQLLPALSAGWRPAGGGRPARSGRRGDSGLPSGSGPRQWAAESMVSFKRSGPSCPRQLSA